MKENSIRRLGGSCSYLAILWLLWEFVPLLLDTMLCSEMISLQFNNNNKKVVPCIEIQSGHSQICTIYPIPHLPPNFSRMWTPSLFCWGTIVLENRYILIFTSMVLPWENRWPKTFYHRSCLHLCERWIAWLSVAFSSKDQSCLLYFKLPRYSFSFCMSHLGPAEESSWPVFSLPLRLEGRSVVSAGLQTLGKGSTVFCCPCLLLGEVYWQKGRSEPLLRYSCLAHMLLPYCGNPDFLALPLGCHHVCRELVSFS